MKVPLLDLSRFNKEIVEEWLEQVRHILESGRILDGPYKKDFEETFAKYLGVKHCLGVASGTDAIFLSLMALDIGPGDEVITHANAFIADIEPIIALGATPILVDKSANDYGPDLEQLKTVINKKTKAILVVHLLGVPSEMDELINISRESGIPIIEDASQAQGASIDGKKVGSMGKIGAFSLGPVKNLRAVGDAGAIVTNDIELYEKIKQLAIHGQKSKYVHTIYGWNSRLDEIQAAWLLFGLKVLDERNNRRVEIYDRYKEAFKALALTSMHSPLNGRSVYHQGVFYTNDRDAFKKYLKEKEIGHGMYYPESLHTQEAWSNLHRPALSFPMAEKYSKEHIALPVFAELTEEEIEYIILSVRDFFNK
ncbi:MAG: DegT/DnrJ/EryC1/StrS family aminotransferase [Candidatus Levybacteria bacterium]|nr:DegT/DnrJ/EryC1/StrS family aminotransferase [Candidatus Levybacteria bacterium]